MFLEVVTSKLGLKEWVGKGKDERNMSLVSEDRSKTFRKQEQKASSVICAQRLQRKSCHWM